MVKYLLCYSYWVDAKDRKMNRADACPQVGKKVFEHFTEGVVLWNWVLRVK